MWDGQPAMFLLNIKIERGRPLEGLDCYGWVG